MAALVLTSLPASNSSGMRFANRNTVILPASISFPPMLTAASTMNGCPPWLSARSAPIPPRRAPSFTRTTTIHTATQPQPHSHAAARGCVRHTRRGARWGVTRGVRAAVGGDEVGAQLFEDAEAQVVLAGGGEAVRGRRVELQLVQLRVDGVDLARSGGRTGGVRGITRVLRAVPPGLGRRRKGGARRLGLRRGMWVRRRQRRRSWSAGASRAPACR